MLRGCVMLEECAYLKRCGLWRSEEYSHRARFSIGIKWQSAQIHREKLPHDRWHTRHFQGEPTGHCWNRQTRTGAERLPGRGETVFDGGGCFIRFSVVGQVIDVYSAPPTSQKEVIAFANGMKTSGQFVSVDSQ